MRAGDVADLVTLSRAAVGSAEAEKRSYAGQLEVVDVAARLSQKRAVEASITQLEDVRDAVEADRRAAEEHRARATELLGGIDMALPDDSFLASARGLAHELEVAEAKLGGGLAVVVERLRAVAVQASAREDRGREGADSGQAGSKRLRKPNIATDARPPPTASRLPIS